MINCTLTAFAYFNILFIIFFMFGQYVIFKDKISPKFQANYALLLTTCFVIYFVMILALSVVGVVKQTHSLLLMLVFFLVPFIIGKSAKYKTLRIFSNLQLLFFFMSLFYSVALLFKFY